MLPSRLVDRSLPQWPASSPLASPHRTIPPSMTPCSRASIWKWTLQTCAVSLGPRPWLRSSLTFVCQMHCWFFVWLINCRLDSDASISTISRWYKCTPILTPDFFLFQVLPLANQITTICGNVLSRTLAGGRSERNDALLLHAFSEQGYLVPDAVFGNFPGAKHARGTAKEPEYTMTTEGGDQDGGDEQRAAGGKRKPAYAGGLVLEPKRGERCY